MTTATIDTTEKHTQPQSPVKRLYATIEAAHEARGDLLEPASGLWVRGDENDEPIAIEVERAYQYMIENARILDFDIGVQLTFCMFARMVNVNVKNPKTAGIVLRMGDRAWPPPATRFNSAPNESTHHGCRVQVFESGADGFVLDGGRSIGYYHSGVEGAACRYAWNIDPRLADSTVRLVDSWCEFPPVDSSVQVSAMIRWAGRAGSRLIVDGFRGWQQDAVWIDATDARDSTIEIRGMGLKRGEKPPVIRVPDSVDIQFDHCQIDARTFYRGVEGV